MRIIYIESKLKNLELNLPITEIKKLPKRLFKEEEMDKVAFWIERALKNTKVDATLAEIRKEVKSETIKELNRREHLNSDSYA